MTNNRLRQLEENLELLREQQGALEQEALMTTGLHKTQAEQRLQREIKPKIRDYEQEYWQILAQKSNQLEIGESDAEAAIAEIVETVNQIEVQQIDTYSAEMLQLLQQIRDKLNQPGTPATAKLKGVISSIPPFIGVSYEAEIDTENFLRKHFPTFTKLLKGAAKK